MLILPKEIKKIIGDFREKNFSTYVVGGSVRDLLLDRTVKDWDLTTSAKPKEILSLLPDGHYNNQYGTVVAKVSNYLVEITTLRTEGKYNDFRHPQKVSWTKNIEEDLARRDFTINAIAFDGKKIIDPFNGQKDLAKKTIRAVGNPEKRFSEDALRLMRAIRFASQLGFIVEEKTLAAVKKNASLIKNIAWERIRDELLKIIGSQYPSEGVLLLKNTGLLGYILPELNICFGVPQKSPHRHHIHDVGTHSVMALKYCPAKDPITRLATLLHDIGKPKTFRQDKKTKLITFYNHEVVGAILTKRIADRLRLNNQQKDKLITLVKYHQFTVSELQTDKAIRRFIRKIGKKYLPDMLALRTGDRIGSGAKPTSWRYELFKKRLIEVQKEPFKITDLKINGQDVMKILHLKPGPKVGQILEKIFNLVVKKKLKNERAPLLKYLGDHGRDK